MASTFPREIYLVKRRYNVAAAFVANKHTATKHSSNAATTLCVSWVAHGYQLVGVRSLDNQPPGKTYLASNWYMVIRFPIQLQIVINNHQILGSQVKLYTKCNVMG